MQIEDYFDFLAPDDIRVRGHRIGIESLLYEYIHRERTPEEIAMRFPTLALDQVYAAILYYLRNQEQMRTYMANWVQWGHKMREEQSRQPSPAVLRLRSLRTEREARQAAENHAP